MQIEPEDDWPDKHSTLDSNWYGSSFWAMTNTGSAVIGSFAAEGACFCCGWWWLLRNTHVKQEGYLVLRSENNHP